MRAEADKAYYQVLGGLRGEFAADVAGALCNRAEEMAVLALEFEQEERADDYSQGHLAAMERGV